MKVWTFLFSFRNTVCRRLTHPGGFRQVEFLVIQETVPSPALDFAQVDWEAWFHKPGMPIIPPKYYGSLRGDAEG